ncbi:hypothetical protein ABEB36_004064 [Hypothenemus hampei]|uniref:Uncharacterized protein n=1 Tax=Hypothenemus hampei TaxID=57062 RepID=A0ABD1F2M3_HYPHA
MTMGNCCSGSKKTSYTLPDNIINVQSERPHNVVEETETIEDMNVDCTVTQSPEPKTQGSDHSYIEDPDFEAVEIRSKEEVQQNRTSVKRARSNRTSTLQAPEVATISETAVVAVAQEKIFRKETLIRQGVQNAAPPPVKRTVSHEARFIIDVPQMEGIGIDGSYMVAFNKVEMNNG